MAFLTYSELVSIGFTVLLLVGLYYQRRYSYWQRKNVQWIEPMKPFGNFGDVVFQRKHIGKVFKTIYDDFKSRNLKFGGVFLFTKPIFVPIDPDITKCILKDDFEHFKNRPNLLQRDILANTLYGLKNEKWQDLNGTLKNIFRPNNTKIVLERVLGCLQETKRAIDKSIDDEELIDVCDIATKFSIDAFECCTFGKRLENSNLSSQRQHILESLSQDAFNPSQLVNPFGLCDFSNRELEKFQKYFASLVEENVTNRRANDKKHNDFLDLLMNLETSKTGSEVEANKSLSLEEITNHLLLLFVASCDITSTLTFCLFEIANDPQIQAQIQDEICEILDDHKNEISLKALAEMNFMEKCILETLRKYPPSTVLFRECTKVYKIPNTDVTLDEGTFVFIPVFGIHWDNDYYPDPEKFNPDRFKTKHENSPCVRLPFGAGPRKCTGSQFAFMQIKIFLTVLLRKYKFTVDETERIKFNPKQFILNPNEEVWLEAEKVSY